jgi:hypothetical protein
MLTSESTTSTEGTHRFDPEQQITVTENGAPLALTAAVYTTTPSDGFGSGDERDMMDFTGVNGGQPAASCTPDPDRVPLALALHTLHTPHGGTVAAAVPALAA